MNYVQQKVLQSLSLPWTLWPLGICQGRKEGRKRKSSPQQGEISSIFCRDNTAIMFEKLHLRFSGCQVKQSLTAMYPTREGQSLPSKETAKQQLKYTQIEICLHGPPLSSCLYYFCAPTSQLDEEEEEWLIFHSSCLIKGFQAFLGQHEGKGCFSRTLLWRSLHISTRTYSLGTSERGKWRDSGFWILRSNNITAVITIHCLHLEPYQTNLCHSFSMPLLFFHATFWKYLNFKDSARFKKYRPEISIILGILQDWWAGKQKLWFQHCLQNITINNSYLYEEEWFTRASEIISFPELRQQVEITPVSTFHRQKVAPTLLANQWYVLWRMGRKQLTITKKYYVLTNPSIT